MHNFKRRETKDEERDAQIRATAESFETKKEELVGLWINRFVELVDLWKIPDLQNVRGFGIDAS